MSNVTPIQAGKGQFSLAPQSLDEAMRFADLLSKSSIVPKDYRGNPGNIMVAIQWGMEIGLQPMQAMQNIAVINGYPSIWGDAMLALVRGSGLLEYINEEPEDGGCTCTVKRRGEPEVSRTFTVEDAKKAGIYGKQGPWQSMPKRMMQMRARAFALRDVFTDVLRGVNIAEEAQDMPEEKDITAESSEIAKPAKKSRAEVAKQALADQRQNEVRLPVVFAAINSAETLEALQTAASMAAHLTSEAEKKAARHAYAERLQALKTPAVDTDTGEVLPQSDDDFVKALG